MCPFVGTRIAWTEIPQHHPANFEVRIHSLVNKTELNGLGGTAISSLNGGIDGYVVKMNNGMEDQKLFRKNLLMKKE